MKECLVCRTKYNVSDKDCGACGSAPAIVAGFEAYAPELAHGGGGFNAAYFAELARLEEHNFWFKVRNDIIVWALKKYASGFKTLLEIGCGTGFVLTGISKNFPDATLNGSEIFTEGLGFAAKRLASAKFMQMDARRIPFAGEFDVIGAFDVLEHIKEDELALDQIHKALTPNGILIVTVPQHAWLWSAVDEYAFHERRYAAKELENKVNSAGFQILRSTSFVSLLLPAMMASRAFQKRDDNRFAPTAELKINPILNAVFACMLKIELAGIKFGMNFPLGGSRLIVAKKI